MSQKWGDRWCAAGVVHAMHPAGVAVATATNVAVPDAIADANVVASVLLGLHAFLPVAVPYPILVDKSGSCSRIKLRLLVWLCLCQTLCALIPVLAVVAALNGVVVWGLLC